MKTLSIAIAALAALSTVSFAEGNHDYDSYGAEMSNGAVIHTRTVRADEETSSEGLSSFQGFKSEGGRGDHAGGR